MGRRATFVVPLLAAALAVLPTAGYADHAETVNIVDFEFMPRVVEVGLHKPVTWVWKANTHSVTSDEDGKAEFSSHPDCPPICGNEGDTFRLVFGQPGTYEYHCSVHSIMHGTVVVVAAQSARPSHSPTAGPTATATAGAPTSGPSRTASQGASASATVSPGGSPTATGSPSASASPSSSAVASEPGRTPDRDAPSAPLVGLAVALALGNAAALWRVGSQDSRRAADQVR